MKVSGFKPLGERVLIRCNVPEAKVGGIHLPDQAKQKAFDGVVEAAGPKATLKRGDQVLLPEHAGFRFIEGNLHYLLVEQSAVTGMVEE